MKKTHMILLGVNISLVLGFGLLFGFKMNYEFLIYVGVIIFFMTLVALTRNRVDYTMGSLIGLTIWSALHLCGGGIDVGGDMRLYDLILIRLSDTLPILRYDQVVHAWGFGVSTVVMYCLLKKSLAPEANNRISLSVVLLSAGMGIGALNEMIEFIVDSTLPGSGVGGYLNTSLDICSNFIGSFLAVIYINLRYLDSIRKLPVSDD